MSNVELIKKIIEENNGILLSRELREKNIHLQYINQLEKSGYIEKVARGIYVKKERNVNEFFVIGERYKKGIFSYNTAFHILNLTNKTPSEIDITVPRDKRVRGNYNVHHVSNNYYEIGIIDVMSPFGNKVKVYNAERCICDMLRSEKEFDLELQNRILDYYFNSKDKNIELLLEYSKIFNIYEKVNTIVEVMMKW